MRIEAVETHLLRIPLQRPVAVADDGQASAIEHISVLLILLGVDAGFQGLGFSWTLGPGGRALANIAEYDLTPLFLNEDPLDHERLHAQAGLRFKECGWDGLAARAYAAFDIALWDIKGKAARLPLGKLLGGARNAVPAFISDAGWRWMSPKQVVEAAQPGLNQGLAGVKVHVGRMDPEDDAHRLTYIREALGEQGWLGVDADERYDFGTALLMGEFLEENGMDWFEDPINCGDVSGMKRLAAKIQVPLALGKTLPNCASLHGFLDRGVGDVLRPDPLRLGGITAWLKASTMAELHQRHVVPATVPELGVHLACAAPAVKMMPFNSWLAPLFEERLEIAKGQVRQPGAPGLGLSVRREALAEFKIQGWRS